MPLFTSGELTPKNTLENLDTLAKKFEFDDDIFRSVNYRVWPSDNVICSLKLRNTRNTRKALVHEPFVLDLRVVAEID
jgi:hypothetical protein